MMVSAKTVQGAAPHRVWRQPWLAGFLGACLVCVCLAAACQSQADCRPGTLFLQVVASQSTTFDELLVAVTAEDGTVLVEGSRGWPSGDAAASLEVDFGDKGYPEGDAVLVAVSGKRQGIEVASAQQSLTLAPGCSRLSLPLPGPADAGSASSGDAVDATSDRHDGHLPRDTGMDGEAPPLGCPGAEGACFPGQERACGNCSLGSEVCTSACQWGGCQEAACPAGAVEFCGTLGSRTCSNSCAWSTCQQPPAFCADPFEDKWNYDLGNASMPWNRIHGDPSIDQAAGQLVLTRDDVASRDKLQGKNYIIAFTLNWTGDKDLAFHTGFVTANEEDRQPAVRQRNGKLELGGLSYGRGKTWGPFGAFNNQSFSVGPLTVAIYVNGEEDKLAMRVQNGQTVVKSGFIKIDGLQEDRLALIGGNTYSADGSAARLGEIVGCDKLTVAALEAAYER